MPQGTRFYVVVVVGVALAIIASLPWTPVLDLGWTGAVGLSCFIGLAILAETMAVQFRVGGPKKVQSSIAFLPIIGAVVAFPLAAGVLGVICILVFVELLRKRGGWIAAFNIAQGVCAVALGGVLFGLLGGGLDFSTLSNVLAFYALVVCFFGTNMLLVSGYFAIDQNRPFVSIVRQAVGAGGGNLWYDLLASPVALIAAMLYAQFHVAGLLLVIFPLLLIRYSYLSKLQLQQANRDLLKVLIKAIETRDPYTSGHSVRVSTLARLIGVEMKMSARDIERLETAALLHDIGKIDMTYAPLIRKPADLTDDERQTIRTHATHGAELLGNLTSLEENVIRGVRHHHERYDGSGYPDGLIGPAIPLIGRIIMVCDAVDAMLSDRPYRRALSPDRVRTELLRFSGSQFDPEVVKLLLRSDVIERAASAVRETSPALAVLSVHGA